MTNIYAQSEKQIETQFGKIDFFCVELKNTVDYGKTLSRRKKIKKLSTFLSFINYHKFSNEMKQHYVII